LKKHQITLKITMIILLLVLYIYVVYVQSIPDNIVVFEGETINLKTILGLKADLIQEDEVVETISSNQSSVMNSVGKKTAKISLFENILNRTRVFKKEIKILKVL